ncbi:MULTISPECIES: organic hydroperoxide resistance protein [Cellulophaga]|jgi:Ohr subfamily peroxiredoxin|uniref:Ohr subfamily peroxiredoxin n=1 Tax=Cellulophaga baltica 18 TaxID=1348584 RepID=A0AAU8REH7_9FLAO|nr:MULTISPECIES: organic hydroperoxide resistance protein [Cellulophaga]WFO17617.1 organic hydroperoxide resistance protein [Cellulophaga baltica 4]AIY13597.1 Ohr subfamily peroxiredoxin [Cellulophaga baltica NN016038]AIZ41967.1 Ohr subfamily peroxiredoxin [Cellulophaga baltica 18]KGK30707.1 Ohr subfamily peroxiredoxin [Cellulophaga sp. E6(2014)]MCR1026912.1 organic hydroperoxide resistance protein [Cellulophaga baltica]
MKTIFESSATNTGGRSGHVTTEGGLIDLDVKMPNGKDPIEEKYTNPEQLFAAAYSTCFAGALQAVAKDNGVDDLGDFSVTAIIGFGKDEDGFNIEATLDAYLPTVDKEKGEELINAAHEICPYSKATRDNITVNLNLLLDE